MSGFNSDDDLFVPHEDISWLSQPINPHVAVPLQDTDALPENDPNIAEEELSPHDYTVQKLYDQLYGTFRGCTAEEHIEAHETHMAKTDNPENHYGLDEINTEPLYTSVLETRSTCHPGQPDFTQSQHFSSQNYPSTEA